MPLSPSLVPEHERLIADANRFTRLSGARVYFFHHILHNWPDGKVKEILQNTASSMTPGYSKLILNEFILPGKDCPCAPSWADIAMMADFSACERTEKQWRGLLGSVGFRDVGFWYPPDSIDGVIEAVLGDGNPSEELATAT